jgi:hypothetical protein
VGGLTPSRQRDVCEMSAGSDLLARAMGNALPVRVAVLAALVGGLFALAPGTASAGFRDSPVYVYSAMSGELDGSRLTLHGVGGRVTWATDGGRFGVISVRRLHRLLFTPKAARATGTLHVAGHRGGQEPVLRLTRPRYDASRGTVSYRIKRLNKGTLPVRGAGRRFGAASLSVAASQAPDGSQAGIRCTTYLMNTGAGPLTRVSETTTDDWNAYPPPGPVNLDVTVMWQSTGSGSGCSNTVTYKVLANPPVEFTIITSYSTGGKPTYSCTPSTPGNPQYSCSLSGAPAGGLVNWQIEWTPTGSTRGG